MKDADDVQDHLWPTEDNIVRSMERASPFPHVLTIHSPTSVVNYKPSPETALLVSLHPASPFVRD